MFWAGKIAALLLLPPNGNVLLTLLGLVLWRRFRRTGRALVAAGLGSLVLLSTPVVGAVLMALVAEGQALRPGQPWQGDAIVVLGGGIRHGATEYGTDVPSIMSLERARYGAFLARERGLPVAVSGGVVYAGRPEGVVIAEVMTREFGVPVRWVEPRSRNTHENAVELAKLLLPAGVKRVLVVTHGVDARRARREMQAAGFDVTMAPTMVPGLEIDGWIDFVPSMSGLRASYLGLYEILGNLRATAGGVR